MAQVYLLQDKQAEAIPALKKALSLAPANPDSTVLLADLYITEKKPDEAVRLITDAMQKNPKDANFTLRSAMILEKLRRWDEAQRAYQQVLQLDGENAVAKNNLASLLVDRGGNLDAALSLAQEAKEKLVNNLQVTNTIGWIYYKKSSYQTALKYLQECAEKDQTSATFQYQLGMTYWKLGRRDEAKQALQNALTLDRNLPDADSGSQHSRPAVVVMSQQRGAGCALVSGSLPHGCGHLSRSQSLLTDEHNRGASGGRQSENVREVSVESDYHARFAGRVGNNLQVAGFVHPDFPGVHRVPAVSSQDHDSCRRQALIEQDAFHAASR